MQESTPERILRRCRPINACSKLSGHPSACDVRGPHERVVDRFFLPLKQRQRKGGRPLDWEGKISFTIVMFPLLWRTMYVQVAPRPSVSVPVGLENRHMPVGPVLRSFNKWPMAETASQSEFRGRNTHDAHVGPMLSYPSIKYYCM